MLSRALVLALLVASANSWLTAMPCRSVVSVNSPLLRKSTSLSMFGGAAPGGESNDEAEAAAKQMGLSLKEYQVAMRMQQNLGVALNAHRSEGGKSGVTVVYDGNVKPVSVALTEE